MPAPLQHDLRAPAQTKTQVPGRARINIYARIRNNDVGESMHRCLQPERSFAGTEHATLVAMATAEQEGGGGGDKPRAPFRGGINTRGSEGVRRHLKLQGPCTSAQMQIKQLPCVDNSWLLYRTRRDLVPSVRGSCAAAEALLLHRKPGETVDIKLLYKREDNEDALTNV